MGVPTDACLTTRVDAPLHIPKPRFIPRREVAWDIRDVEHIPLYFTRFLILLTGTFHRVHLTDLCTLFAVCLGVGRAV